MKVLAKVAALLAVIPVITSAVPLPSSSDNVAESAAPATLIRDNEPSTQLTEPSSPAVSDEDFKPAEDFEFFDDDDDPVILRRLRRDLYDRDPWGRVQENRRPYYKRGYGRKTPRYSTRRFSRGRRREHHNYRGPDYGDDFENTFNTHTNNGYVDTSVFDKAADSIDTSALNKPPKPNNNFVSARSSGVARTETSGTSI